ncbi:MAG: hypothetical protein FWH11_04250 [Micrococcales bacterium]|nr:hypothetical protein [Micrococcales bacterium]
MTDDSTTSGQRAVRVQDTAWVAAASGWAGLTGLVVMLVATVVLEETQYTEFTVFWSLLFWIGGSMNGAQYESLRATAAAGRAGTGVRILPVMMALSAGVALALLLVLPWSGALFDTDPVVSGVLVAGSLLLFGGEQAVVGLLNGQGRWRAGAWVLLLDATLRFSPFLVLPLLDAAPLAYKVAAASGPLALVVVLSLRRGRALVQVRGDDGARALASAALHTFASTFATATFLVGYPVLMGVLLAPEVMKEPATAGLLFVMSMTRAPLMVPLTAFQGMLIAHFVRRGVVRSAALRVVGLVVLVGSVLSAVLGLVGPPLLRLHSKDAFHLHGGTVALLALGATAIGVIAVTGNITLAAKRHRWYTAGWAVAIAVAVAVLVAPGALQTRVVVSLVVGPLCGAVVHVVGLRPRVSPTGVS